MLGEKNIISIVSKIKNKVSTFGWMDRVTSKIQRHSR